MEMKLHLLEGRTAEGLVSFGTYWPRGKVRECGFSAVNDHDQPVRMQSAPAAYWPDGSIKWARHTADAGAIGKALRVENSKDTSASHESLQLIPVQDGYQVRTACMQFDIPAPGGDTLIRNAQLHGLPVLTDLKPVFLLSRVDANGDCYQETVSEGRPRIDQIEIEDQGPVSATVCYRGVYCSAEDLMRFEIRIRFGIGAPLLQITNTFFYHGDPSMDRMKGLGLRARMPLEGEACNHHVRFLADGVEFHEPAQLMESRIPRTGPEMKRKQLKGEFLHTPKDPREAELFGRVQQELPVWNRFTLSQSGQNTCTIRKRTKEGFCTLDAYRAVHGDGVMAVGAENAGAIFGIRDFWQRYPSALRVDDLGKSDASLTAWFWSPESPAMDFKHYDDHSYMANYEGFAYFGADPEGIAVTSEASLLLTDSLPDMQKLQQFAKAVQKPPVYVYEPEDYHALEAFGPWSLPAKDSDEGKMLESFLDSAITYYQEQQEQRGWYGFFDYGDFRHSYDPDRHTWKYDIGGWAWQQTELVPTYWLWLQFLRTGREDIFSLAEAMSRNTSEVDCYHFGPLKGLGSRHNVRHWGCPCKEPRVSMAGHHRPMFYLTGDLRIGQCMKEMANAHLSLQNVRWYTENEGKIRCRTAPDWSSLVSDWMTEYERTLNKDMFSLVRRGCEGILSAPMGFGSGPEFSFIPETGEMRYEGEQRGGIHLTQCFATLQILLESAEAMDIPALRDMCVQYGQMYLMTPSEREQAYGTLPEGKEYGMPYTASGMAAFAGMELGNEELQKRAWKELLLASPLRYSEHGFESQPYAHTSDGRALKEIPWMSTNYISQWCLNTIMLLAFAKDAMPSKSEMRLIARESYRLAL